MDLQVSILSSYLHKSQHLLSLDRAELVPPEVQSDDLSLPVLGQVQPPGRAGGADSQPALLSPGQGVQGVESLLAAAALAGSHGPGRAQAVCQQASPPVCSSQQSALCTV